MVDFTIKDTFCGGEVRMPRTLIATKAEAIPLASGGRENRWDDFVFCKRDRPVQHSL